MSVSPSHAETPELPVVSRHSARTFPAPADLRVEPSAWSAFATTQTDTLVVGEPAAVSRVLSVMWPTLQKPVLWCEGRRLLLPASCEGTLILEDIHVLDIVDQQRLLDWLSTGPQSPRLIAMASRRLEPLVDSGWFLRSLYSRVKGLELIVT
jgi:hypothetical protein